MIHTLLTGAIVYAVGCQGYQISPPLVNMLSNLCEYQSTVLIGEMIQMFPDELVFDMDNLSDVLGIVIIEGASS